MGDIDIVVMKCAGLVALLLTLGLTAADTGTVTPDGKAEFESDLTTYSRWLQANGLESFKVGLWDIEMGDQIPRAVVAQEDIPSDSVIAKIPVTLGLLPTYIDDILNPVLQEHPSIGRGLRLALFLLSQRHNPESPFAPWFNTLPAEPSSVYFWSEKELSEFQASTVRGDVAERHTQLQTDYTNMFPGLSQQFPALFPPEYAKMEDFEWAVSTATSRAVYMDVNTEVVPCIIPFQDVFRVAVSGQEDDAILRITDDGTAMEIIAARDLEAGHEITLPGGEIANGEMLMEKGVSFLNNPHNYVTMGIRLPERDPYRAAKLDMMKHNGMSTDDLYALTESSVPEALFGALRVRYMKSQHLDKWETLNVTTAFDLEIELSVVRQVVATCQQLEAQYPTTIEEDVALLEQTQDRPMRWEIAIVHRIAEKKIYRACVRHALSKWESVIVSDLL